MKWPTKTTVCVITPMCIFNNLWLFKNWCLESSEYNYFPHKIVPYIRYFINYWRDLQPFKTVQLWWSMFFSIINNCSILNSGVIILYSCSIKDTISLIQFFVGSSCKASTAQHHIVGCLDYLNIIVSFILLSSNKIKPMHYV